MRTDLLEAAIARERAFLDQGDTLCPWVETARRARLSGLTLALSLVNEKHPPPVLDAQSGRDGGHSGASAARPPSGDTR